MANDTKDLSSKMRAQFPEPPPVTVDLLENMVRKALMLGRKEMPLTLIVLDEVQQFIRQDPALTLKIQTMVERLSSRFDGKILVVATGQQALSDVSNLQKLLDRFPVQVALGEADVDAVIRKTVLRKKPGVEADIKAVLSKNAGEISRHLRGSKLAHSVQDNEDAVLDWPLLPSRRRVHNAWDEDLSGVEKEVAAASPTDATVHLLIPNTRQEELTRSLATRRAAESVLHLKGIPGTESGKEAQRAMQSRADRASAIARDIISESVQHARVMQAGGQVISGSPTEAIKEAATNALARLYPKFSDADHLGWGKVFDRAQKKDPDALKAVDYQGPAEGHPICKIILQDLGPGRKGADLRAKFTSSPYGWSQDTVDGALMVLSNAGILKVTGDDGKQASLPDLPRAKIGACTFRAETTVVTITQKMAVRGLLTEAGVPFEKEQEGYALSALIERLEILAKHSGGEAPAPLAEQVPEIATLRALSGNDLLAHLANAAQALREKIKSWDAASKTINQRLPNWLLANRLIALGAKDQQADIEHVLSARNLLANPDPVPPIVAAAADALRQRINKSFDIWDKAWLLAEERLSKNDSWQKLTADQRRHFREEAALLPVSKPSVDTPTVLQKVAES